MLVTERNVGTVLEFLSKHRRLVIDTETTGFYTWHGARIVGISVAPPKAPRRHCYYFPFRHRPGGNLPMQRMRQLLRIIERRDKTGWNFNQFDTHMLMAEGMREPEYAEDMMLALHLLSEDEKYRGGSYELKIAASRYVEKKANAAQLRLTEMMADRGLDKGEMDQLAPHELDEYASDDVYYTERMREVILPALEEWELEEIAREVNKYALITRRFEARGLKIDRRSLHEYTREAEAEAAKLLRRIQKLAGYEINLRSPKQVQKWLRVPSSAKDYLEEREFSIFSKEATNDRQRSILALLEYRQWDKVLTSYYNVYERKADRDDILHPNIMLHGTVAGRPSCKDPNLQAVPRQTSGRAYEKVKHVFIARKGYEFVSADYSQMELRLGAHLSQDEFLIDAFNTKKNVHRMMMEDIQKLGYKDIDYDKAKRVNFAVMYGTGKRTLSKEIRTDETTAAKFLGAAHCLHPNYRPLLEQAEDTAREFGYLRMWTGRVRRFNMPEPEFWFHKALSNLIQGGVAEVMRVAITRLGDALPEHDAHMLLQVHDQILFEIPLGTRKKMLPLIRGEMTRDFPFSVPFIAETKVGKRWGTLEEVA